MEQKEFRIVIDNQDKLLSALQGIEGLPIWKAENSHGSMAIIEIGKPHLELRSELRSKKTPNKSRGIKNWRVFAVGQYSLHIWDCDWEVKDGNRYIGGPRSKDFVQKGLKFIEGRFIQRVEIRPRDCKLILGFERGVSLRLKLFDHLEDLWYLYRNKGKRWSIFFNEFGDLEKEKSFDHSVII